MGDEFEQSIWETEDDLAEVAHAKQLEQAKSVAMKYISSRVRTEKETVEYLQKKGLDAACISEVIAFLHRYQYLNDAAYCRAWIHDRIQFHPCGRQKMAAELSRKVSDHQLVQMSLEEYFSEEQELALALAAATQKVRTFSTKKQITREQLARFLYGRGYGGDIIGQVLQTVSLKAEQDGEVSAFEDF